MKTKHELADFLRSSPIDGRKRVTEAEMFDIFDAGSVQDDVKAWLAANDLDLEVEPDGFTASGWYFRRKHNSRA